MFSKCAALLFVASLVLEVHAECLDEACEVDSAQMSASSSALLQVHTTKEEHSPRKALLQNNITHRTMSCSYNLVGDQDGSKPCRKLKGKKYTSGRNATLDEDGYQETAKLCCHHEMSLFVRREIKRQKLEWCDLSDLHGFVHWYDCPNDKKTYKEMKEEIAGVIDTACPWLTKKGESCPKKDPVHCGVIAKSCKKPAGSQAGSSAPLSQEGYAAVAKRCCHTEMEAFIRRQIKNQSFVVCDEGAFNGFLHWFDCTNDHQTFEQLEEGLVMARSGLPPMCPWLGSKRKACPPKGHNCPVVEVAEPAAHRRRYACR